MAKHILSVDDITPSIPLPTDRAQTYTGETMKAKQLEAIIERLRESLPPGFRVDWDDFDETLDIETLVKELLEEFGSGLNSLAREMVVSKVLNRMFEAFCGGQRHKAQEVEDVL